MPVMKDLAKVFNCHISARIESGIPSKGLWGTILLLVINHFSLSTLEFGLYA